MSTACLAVETRRNRWKTHDACLGPLKLPVLRFGLGGWAVLADLQISSSNLVESEHLTFLAKKTWVAHRLPAPPTSRFRRQNPEEPVGIRKHLNPAGRGGRPGPHPSAVSFVFRGNSTPPKARQHRVIPQNRRKRVHRGRHRLRPRRSAASVVGPALQRLAVRPGAEAQVQIHVAPGDQAAVGQQGAEGIAGGHQRRPGGGSRDWGRVVR